MLLTWLGHGCKYSHPNRLKLYMKFMEHTVYAFVNLVWFYLQRNLTIYFFFESYVFMFFYYVYWFSGLCKFKYKCRTNWLFWYIKVTVKYDIWSILYVDLEKKSSSWRSLSFPMLYYRVTKSNMSENLELIKSTHASYPIV